MAEENEHRILIFRKYDPEVGGVMLLVFYAIKAQFFYGSCKLLGVSSRQVRENSNYCL